jgi:hypothetical protein
MNTGFGFEPAGGHRLGSPSRSAVTVSSTVRRVAGTEILRFISAGFRPGFKRYNSSSSRLNVPLARRAVTAIRYCPRSFVLRSAV